MHSQCFARVLLPRVSFSFLSLSLYSLSLSPKKQNFSTPRRGNRERERQKCLRRVANLCRKSWGKLPRRTKPSLVEARKGKRQTRRQRERKVFWKSHNAVQNNFTYVVKWNPCLKRHRRSRSENSSNASAKPPIANSNWYSTRYRGTTGNRSHRSKRNERSCIT